MRINNCESIDAKVKAYLDLQDQLNAMENDWVHAKVVGTSSILSTEAAIDVTIIVDAHSYCTMLDLISSNEVALKEDPHSWFQGLDYEEKLSPSEFPPTEAMKRTTLSNEVLWDKERDKLVMGFNLNKKWMLWSLTIEEAW
ncbi:hypothetical protein RYX36_024370 [Vicia faba]